MLFNLLSACIGLAAALFLCIGAARLSNQAIWLLSSTFWDYNPHLASALISQRADYVAGATLLIATFLAQVAANLAPPVELGAVWHGIGAVVLTSAAVVLLALAVRYRVAASARSFVDAQAAGLRSNDKPSNR